MVQPMNPYGQRGPIEDPKDFYGRTDTLSQLFECIKTRRSIALIGERRSGKTSILFQIKHKEVQPKYLVHPDDFVFVYVTGEQVPGPHAFFQRLFELIAEQTPSFTFQWDDQVPISEACILLQQLRPLKLVVLIDEIDHIVAQRAFTPGTFHLLRSIASQIKSVCDVSFIVATKRDLADDLAPRIGEDDLATAAAYFLNIFNKCFIGSFSQEEFQSFLEETSRHTGVPLFAYKQQIADLAGRFPFFVQIACYHYFEVMVKNGQPPDHALVRHKFLDEARSHFTYIWIHLDSQERALVSALARGERSPQDKLWALARKGYAVEGNLFSSAFAEFVRREAGVSPTQPGVSFDDNGNVCVVDNNGNLRVIPRERLAPLERDLLVLLYENKGKACGYGKIRDEVWAKHDQGYLIVAPPIDSINQTVRRLREKIELDPGNPCFIINIPKEGYRLVDP